MGAPLRRLAEGYSDELLPLHWGLEFSCGFPSVPGSFEELFCLRFFLNNCAPRLVGRSCGMDATDIRETCEPKEACMRLGRSAFVDVPVHTNS